MSDDFGGTNWNLQPSSMKLLQIRWPSDALLNWNLSTFVILFQQIHFWQFYLNSYLFWLCLFGPPNISQTLRILWPVIAIRLKFAASWIIRVWTYNEFPRSIRFDPESNTYILGEYDIFALRSNTSTSNHHFFASSTIRLRLQGFVIRFDDKSWISGFWCPMVCSVGAKMSISRLHI